MTPQAERQYLELERCFRRELHRKALQLAWLPGYGTEDIEQVGRMALLQAVVSHEPQKGKLVTLARHTLRNAITDLIREATAERRLQRHHRRGLDNAWERCQVRPLSLDWEVEGWQGSPDEWTEVTRTLERVRKRLNQRALSILARRLAHGDEPLPQVRKLFGLTKRQCDRAVHEIRDAVAEEMARQ